MSQWHVIIPAGGSGQRFGSSTPKQFLVLGEDTLLNVTLKRFLAQSDVAQIVVSLPVEHLNHSSLLIDDRIDYVEGGQSRSESVYNGFQALKSVQPRDVVLVHDAARPFPSTSTIQSVAQSTQKVGSAIPVVPVTDTIKTKDDKGCVLKTIPRSELFAVQTPQGFLVQNLQKAYQDLDFASPTYTDESMLMEAIGVSVAMVEGNVENFKITAPFDLQIAESILESGF